MATDHYRTLRVEPDASSAELRTAYLKLARAYHPDTFDGIERRTAEAEMQKINEAWNVLGTPHRRAEYDRSRPREAGRAATSGPMRGRTHFEPFDDDPWDRSDVDLDPTPIAGSVGIPQWVSFVPILFVASGVLSFGFGLLVQAASIISFAVVIFFLGVIGFGMIPLWVMSRAERDPEL